MGGVRVGDGTSSGVVSNSGTILFEADNVGSGVVTGAGGFAGAA